MCCRKMCAAGLALWVVYGILNQLTPLVATNLVGFLLIVSLIAMKMKFDRQPTKD